MARVSSKNKIYAAIFLWVALTASMFGYFFEKLGAMSAGVATTIKTKNQELAFLVKEQQNFKQAMADLEKLSAEPYQPDAFFNRDISLINELRTLESLAVTGGVEITISNLRGTLKDAQKAKNTKGEVFIVPFNMAVLGEFPKVVAYLETLENLQFVTNISNVSINSSGQGQVTLAISANFYLKK